MPLNEIHLGLLLAQLYSRIKNGQRAWSLRGDWCELTARASGPCPSEPIWSRVLFNRCWHTTNLMTNGNYIYNYILVVHTIIFRYYKSRWDADRDNCLPDWDQSCWSEWGRCWKETRWECRHQGISHYSVPPRTAPIASPTVPHCSEPASSRVVKFRINLKMNILIILESLTDTNSVNHELDLNPTEIYQKQVLRMYI